MGHTNSCGSRFRPLPRQPRRQQHCGVETTARRLPDGTVGTELLKPVLADFRLGFSVDGMYDDTLLGDGGPAQGACSGKTSLAMVTT